MGNKLFLRNNRFILSVVAIGGSVGCGIMLLILGAGYGANFYFPSFGHNYGYEAAGVFFGIVGLNLGALLPYTMLKNKNYVLVGVHLAFSIPATILSLLIFDYTMPRSKLLFIVCLPFVLSILFVNLKNNYEVS